MRQNHFYANGKAQAMTLERDRETISISVIIVSYNSRSVLHDCLASLESELWNQVIVVDNLSSDGSAEMVREDFPWANLIVSKKNGGYGAAANLAIAECSTKYVLLLNPDTVLHPGATQVLGDYLDQYPQVAIAGPQLLNPDGTRQISCFEYPTPLATLKKETSLARLGWHSSNVPSVGIEGQSDPAAQSEFWVLGAALAIRRNAFDFVGGFDESYFMYYEEVDLCYRLKQAGWQIDYVPGTAVMHIGGASTKRQRAAMLRQLYRSLCHFYQQHYSGSQKALLRLILTYLMFRNILRDRLRSYRLLASHSDAVENLSVWRSILTGVWSSNGWLKD